MTVINSASVFEVDNSYSESCVSLYIIGKSTERKAKTSKFQKCVGNFLCLVLSGPTVSIVLLDFVKVSGPTAY